MNKKDCITIILQMVKIMTTLNKARFWAIWLIFLLGILLFGGAAFVQAIRWW
jgi:hypothetical protein